MMRPRSVTALVAGLALVVLGVLLVLNADGSVDLGFAYMAPAVVGLSGAILLVSGIEARSRGRG